MTKKLLSIVFLLFTLTSYAQVGVGTQTPAASAMLDVTSTERGLLPPRMSAQQRTNIQNPVEGLMVYQSDAPTGYYLYKAGSWKRLMDEDDVSTTIVTFASERYVTLRQYNAPYTLLVGPNTDFGVNDNSDNLQTTGGTAHLLPRNGTLTTMSAYFTVGQIATNYYDSAFQARLYKADPNSSLYRLIPNALVNFSIPQGTYQIGYTFEGSVTGLSIPLEAGSRYLVGFTGGLSISNLSGFAGAALSIK
ncbi:hypothetical protein GCM10027592_02820 [Spirosoma flavus]